MEDAELFTNAAANQECKSWQCDSEPLGRTYGISVNDESQTGCLLLFEAVVQLHCCGALVHLILQAIYLISATSLTQIIPDSCLTSCVLLAAMYESRYDSVA